MLVPWKRFWVPMGEASRCGLEGKDFLDDPESDFGKHSNPSVSALSELLDRPCLVLLGEPGMGKSSTIEAARPDLRAAYGEGNCIWIRFRDIPNTDTFTRRVFDSDAWRAWRSGIHRLLLVIDGIDEGRQKIPDFVSYLRGELELVDKSRLNVILVCRVADWPVSTGNQLQALWPTSDKPTNFELCPLRQIDARAAAEAHKVNPDAFVQAIYEKHVIGLAARPVTLFMLLRAFARNHQLPGTFRDLYRQGCQILSAEVNQERIEELRHRFQMQVLPSDEQKLAVATRIAALLMLSGKSAVYYGPEEDAVADDLLLSVIASGSETVAGKEFHVSKAWAFYSLESALFSARGQNRLGFAHQTFAESLAGAYLIPVPLAQIKAVLCQRDTNQQYVIPQLAEVGAWLAGDHEAFLDFLLTNEPEILLRTDLALIPANQKRKLLLSLLEKAKKEEIFDTPSSDRFYAGLQYQGMSADLLATIADPASNFVARRMAVEIAGECLETEMTTPLLALIRDPAENSLKRFAARALKKLTPTNRLDELVPLANGTASEDPDDEIKASALEALIPRHTSVGNAVPWLTRPLEDHHIGSYWTVLHYHIPRSIVDGDVPALLSLVADRSSCFDHVSAFKEIADKTFCAAIRLLDDTAVADAFVAAWLDKALNHRPLPLDKTFKFNTIFHDDEVVRRRIIELLLTAPQTTIANVRHLVVTRVFSLSLQDLTWLLALLPTMCPTARPKWIEAIKWQVYPESVVGCWDAFLEALDASPDLQALVGDNFRAWQLQEPIAVEARRSWSEEREFLRRHTSPPRRPIEEIIDEQIAIGMAGNSRVWVPLSANLFRETGSSKNDFYLVDLTKAPGWKKASVERQREILAIARRFLTENGDAPRERGVITNFTTAGFRALSVMDDAIRAEAELQEIVRAKWLRALVDITFDGDAYRRAVSLAFSLDAGFCTDMLKRDFAEDGERHQFMSMLRALEPHWRPEFTETTKRLLLAEPGPEGVHNILKFLSRIDRPAAIETLNQLLILRVVIEDPNLLKNVLSAGISNLITESWPRIEPILNAQPELAKLVFLQVAHHSDAPSGSLILATDPDGIVKFYKRLRELFPPDEDPPHNEVTSTRWTVARLRDQQLTMLTSIGTMEACRALLDIARTYPQDSLWIRWRYKECLTLTRQKAWQPCGPGQILKLVERSANRLIMDEEDLLEVVMESLGRFEVSLVGTSNPQVASLWNYQGGGNRRKEFAPKDEEDLSGAIAAWLQRDLGPTSGVILNREVQPKRGQRTDVLVDAIANQDRTSRLTVVLEVKGCWNAEIPVAVQQQLVDTYLVPNGWTHGIFLIGWYICPRWDSTAKPPSNRLTANTLQDARDEVSAMTAQFDGKQSPFFVRGFVLDCRLT